MAGSATIQNEKKIGKLHSFEWSWTSNATGDVSGGDTKIVTGILRQFQAIPVSGVSANYDVTVSGGGLNDVLGGDGANLAATSDGQIKSLTAPAYLMEANLDITIANAGTTQAGIFRVMFERPIDGN